MVALTPISRTEPSFYVPVVAAFGAFFGIFIGTGQGSLITGVLAGAILMAIVAFVLTKVIKNERAGRWAVTALVAAGGFALAGIPGLLIGIFFGWFFGFLTF